jgi:uncharacterized phiE125 gp8 family phage protein
MLQDLRLAAPPATLAVSLDEMKSHLRIDAGITEHDADITAMLNAVHGLLDGYGGVLGRCLVQQSWTLSFECWPGLMVHLPLPPLISLTTFSYLDVNGVSQTVDPNLYTVLDGPLAGLRLLSGKVWPILAPAHPRAVNITFVAGYGAAAAVPGNLKAAIKLLTADLFEHREGQIIDVRVAVDANPAVARLLKPFRVPRL